MAETAREFVGDYIPYEENLSSMAENARQTALKNDSALLVGSRSAWYVFLPAGYYVYIVDGTTGKTREIGGDRLLTLRFGNAGLLQNFHLLITSHRLGGEPRLLGKILGSYTSEQDLVNAIATQFSLSGPLGILSKTAQITDPAQKRPVTLAYVSSDRGQVRETNEDCGAVVNISVANEQSSARCTLTGVADGVGGLASGEIASKLAISAGMSETIYYLLKDGNADPSTTFSPVFESANEKIMKVASYAGKSMASTLSLGIVKGGRVWTGNAGDTRIYGIKSQENRILQLSTDHRLEKEGPQSHVITRSLGSREHAPDISSSFDMQNGDFLVSCSDGLHDLVSEEGILESTQSRRTPKEICLDLTSRANSRGGKDNITVATLLWNGSLTS